jgi:hypothetical protein
MFMCTPQLPFNVLSSDEYLTRYTGDAQRNVQRGLLAQNDRNSHTRLTTVKITAQYKI